jgi:hypothetical protein
MLYSVSERLGAIARARSYSAMHSLICRASGVVWAPATRTSCLATAAACRPAIHDDKPLQASPSHLPGRLQLRALICQSSSELLADDFQAGRSAECCLKCLDGCRQVAFLTQHAAHVAQGLQAAIVRSIADAECAQRQTPNAE